MRDERQITLEMAAILRSARAKAGVSLSALAEMVGRDDKTVANWEKGKTSPTAAEFIMCFDALGQPLLRPVLELIFPEQYKDLNAGSTTDDIRDALVRYLTEAATDEEIRGLSFIIFCAHGSSWHAQLQEFIALDHLPMSGRLHAAQGIYDNYMIAEAAGTLALQDHIKPDLEVLRTGIDKGREAALNGQAGYSTAKK